MNPKLHHMWNAVRDATRGSGKEGPELSKEQEKQNKITLRHNKPR